MLIQWIFHYFYKNRRARIELKSLMICIYDMRYFWIIENMTETQYSKYLHNPNACQIHSKLGVPRESMGNGCIIHELDRFKSMCSTESMKNCVHWNWRHSGEAELIDLGGSRYHDKRISRLENLGEEKNGRAKKGRKKNDESESKGWKWVKGNENVIYQFIRKKCRKR